MLRASVRSAQLLRSRSIVATTATPAAGRVWRAASVGGQRLYADVSKASTPSTAKAATPSTTKAATASTASTVAKASASTVAKAPKKKGFFRRLRNYVLTLSILGALAFGSGVWYSRVNDNFHDFFVEYVPYGEQAVLYLEELDFQKRFPNIASKVSSPPLRDTGANVRVPAQSGASWRVADTENSRQSAALSKKEEAAKAKAAKLAKAAEAKSIPTAAEDATAANAGKAVAAAVPQKTAAKEAKEAKKTKKEKAVAAPAVVAAPTPAPAPASPPAPAFKAPEVDEPSRWPPASPIDPLAVADAKEPVVQDIVHMLNDIITVINADRASDKYGAAIGKAKASVEQVGRKIRGIRETAETEAAHKVQERTESFDKAGRALVERVEAAMAVQEAQWRQQYEAELSRVRSNYEERVATATARERQLSEERLQNRLLEQAVQLTTQFADELKARVEQERAGRLGRLQELSAAVGDLERLTAGWTGVVEASQRAQQLHVATDALRARLADEARDQQPFVRELVAIKEIAAADPVVDAAIASIPPAAYQRGIASPAALVERFRRVAAEVRKASLLPEDAGVASHASSYVLSKVLFQRPVSATATDDAGDVESVLARTQALLEEGNLDAAAREVNGLQGWAKTLSRDWLAEVRKVLEVEQAVEVITAEARLQSLQLEKN